MTTTTSRPTASAEIAATADANGWRTGLESGPAYLELARGDVNVTVWFDRRGAVRGAKVSTPKTTTSPSVDKRNAVLAWLTKAAPAAEPVEPPLELAPMPPVQGFSASYIGSVDPYADDQDPAAGLEEGREMADAAQDGDDAIARADAVDAQAFREAFEEARAQLEAVRGRVRDRLKLARKVRADAEATVVRLRVEQAAERQKDPADQWPVERWMAELAQLEVQRQLVARSDARVDELERLAELV